MNENKFRARRLVLLLRWVALNDELRGKDLRVLLYLLDRLRNGDFIRVSHSAMSEELRMSPSNVSKALKHLVDIQILEVKDSTSGWRNFVRFVPYSEETLLQKIDESFACLDDDED